MTRLLFAAALALLPIQGPADPTTATPTAVAPLQILPPRLAELDAQTRTGAELDATDTFCDHRDVVAASLIEDYHEEMIDHAGMPGERALELWASAEAGTWTLVYLRADGVACVADFGDGWTPDGSTHPLIAELGITV